MGKASRRKQDVRRALQARNEQRNNAVQNRQAAVGATSAIADPPIDPQATHFTSKYGADFLCAHGALIVASWGVPQALAQALAAVGRPIPPRVLGALLLDTGATGTCMSEKAATMLGLPATRLQPGYGAGGRHESAVHLADLQIMIPGQRGTGNIFGWEQEVAAIPNLDLAAQGVQMNGQAMEVIGLLGRDILRHTRLVYNGPTGTLDFEFHLPWLQANPSRQ